MPVSQAQESTSHAALVIIGTGLAGVGVARALRRLGDQRSITLISADSGDDYSKPLLSSGFSKGLTPEALAQRSAAQLGEELDARIITHTRVSALDVDKKVIMLEKRPPLSEQQDSHLVGDNQSGDNPLDHNQSSHGQLIYDQLIFGQLVLATGAEPRIPFSVHPNVASRCFTINDLDDYRRFYDALAQCSQRKRVQRQGLVQVAIIGAGLVGCEFANDLHAGGHDVSVIAPESSLLARLLPLPLGNALGDAFHKAGITLHLGRTVKEISLNEDERLVTCMDDGTILNPDFVLIATGLAPRTALANAAGLIVSEQGIHVDRQLRTSHPDIYALGDVACVEGINAMYVQPLQASAKAIAATLSGVPTSVSFGAWPIVVKTPLLPVVAYPPQTTPERWQIEGEGSDISALAENKDGRLIGFALTGGRVRRKVELSRAAPALLG